MKNKKPAGKRDLNDYSRQYEHDYAFEPIAAAERRRAALAALRRHYSPRILEVGCGLAPIFTSIARFDELALAEPAAAFAKKANELRLQLPPARARKVFIKQAPLEECAEELRARRFGFAFVAGVLHEVEDAAAFLHAARAALPRGAAAFFNVPNARSFHRLLAVEMGLIKSESAPSALQKRLQQPRIYTAESLRRALRAAGFSVCEEYGLMLKPFAHAQMQALFDSGFLTAQMLRGLNAMLKHLPKLAAELCIVARAK